MSLPGSPIPFPPVSGLAPQQTHLQRHLETQEDEHKSCPAPQSAMGSRQLWHSVAENQEGPCPAGPPAFSLWSRGSLSALYPSKPHPPDLPHPHTLTMLQGWEMGEATPSGSSKAKSGPGTADPGCILIVSLAACLSEPLSLHLESGEEARTCFRLCVKDSAQWLSHSWLLPTHARTTTASPLTNHQHTWGDT